MKTGDAPVVIEASKTATLRRSVRLPGAAESRAARPQARSQDDLWVLLIEFALSQRGWWTEVCGTLDLTPTQGLALRLLDPNTPMAMNVLADTLACDASNVTGVVDKLEARGLIARQATKIDRRVKVLAVTDKGRELRRKLFEEAAKPPAAIAAMPRDGREKLSALLRTLLSERTNGAAADRAPPSSKAPPAKTTGTIPPHRAAG